MTDRVAADPITVDDRSVHAPATWARARALVAAPPAQVALLVVVSTVVRAALGSRMSAPWIIPDEALYAGLAESVAAGALPAVHGVVTLTWGLVYPLLIAPAWILFTPESAYHAALAINGFVMSLVAIPAYFVARMFVSRRGALLVAGMSLLVPSMAYAGVVMTEAAFYPAFLTAVLAIVHALDRPTVGRQAMALAAIGLLALVRPQGVVLAGAYGGCVVTHAWLLGSGEQARYLARFVPSAVVSVVLLVLVVTGSLASGNGGLGWLGAHAGVLSGDRLLEAPVWLVLQTSELLVYTAVAPIAAVAVLSLLRATRIDRRSRLFVALVVPIALTMLVAVALVNAAVDVDGHETVDERYLFYLVPLMLVGLALWIEQGMSRPRRVTGTIIALCCLLTVALPVERLSYNADFQALALLPWLVVDSPTLTAVLLMGFTLASGLVWACMPPNRSGYLWMLVGGWFLVVGSIAHQGMVIESTQSRAQRVGDRPSWVDDAADGSDVVALWNEMRATPAGPDVEFQTLVVNDVFNRSIDRVLRLGPSTYYEHVFPTSPVSVARDGLVLENDRPVGRARYVLTSCTLPVMGDVVERNADADLVLYRADLPLRLADGSACRRSETP